MIIILKKKRKKNDDSLHATLNSHYDAYVYKIKKHKKINGKGNLFKKNLQLKGVSVTRPVK